jgi:SAM-dependent methyltransferase
MDTDTCADLLWSAEPNRWVVEELAALRPGRAVDLGCGEGRDAVWLAEHGWQVMGIDFSATAIAKARALAAARGVDVRWVVAEVADHPFDEGTAFDLVLVAYLHPRRHSGRRCCGGRPGPSHLAERSWSSGTTCAT